MFSFIPPEEIKKIKDDFRAKERALIEEKFDKKEGGVLKINSPSANLFFMISDTSSPTGYHIIRDNSKVQKNQTLSAGFYTFVKTECGHFILLQSRRNMTQHQEVFNRTKIKNGDDIVEAAGEVYANGQGKIILLIPRSGSYWEKMNKTYEISGKNLKEHAARYAEKIGLPSAVVFCDYGAFGDDTATPRRTPVIQAIDFFVSNMGKWKANKADALKYVSQKPLSVDELITQLAAHNMAVNKEYIKSLDEDSLLFLSCFVKGYENYLHPAASPAHTATPTSRPNANNRRFSFTAVMPTTATAAADPAATPKAKK